MTDRTVTVYLRMLATGFRGEAQQSKQSVKDLRHEIERLEMAGKGLLRGGIVAGLAGIPGLLSPAITAVGAMPGLVTGAVTSFTALRMATLGVGSAMKAVGEHDADKLEKAMAGLSANAREFVLEYKKVKPLLDAAREASQDGFFAELGEDDLEKLVGNLLPTLLNQLPQLSQAYGRVAKESMAWAGQPETVAAINRQFAFATEAADDFGRMLREGIGLMLDLSDVSKGWTGIMEGGADLLQGTRTWLSTIRATGQLNDLLNNSSRVLQKLGQVAAETGDLLFDMAASPALADAAIALLDTLHMMLAVVHALVSAFSALPGPVQTVVASLLAVGGVAAIMVSRIAVMKAALGSAVLKLNEMGPAGERAARGLQRGAVWAGRAAGAFAALAVVGAVGSIMRGSRVEVDALATSLAKFGATAKADSAITAQFGEDLELLQHDLERTARNGLKDLQGGAAIESLFGNIPDLFTDWSDNLTLQRMTDLDAALAQLARSGNAQGATSAFAKLRAEAAKLGIDEAKLLELLPQYRTAVEQGATATKELADAKAKASMNAAILNEGLAGAVKEAGSLAKAFDVLHGKTLAFADAEIEVEEAIDKVTESLKENGKTLDVTTEKGRENKRALLGMIEASVEVAQKKLDETGSLQQANAVYNSYIGQLRAAMLAAGMNKAEVDKLLAAYANMPPLIQTQVTTPGLDEALRKMRDLRGMLSFFGPLGALASAAFSLTVPQRWGGVTEHAQTGLLRDAQTFSAVSSGARYAFAEPGTGGEAFVPKYGNPSRSLGILNHAAGWYGHTIAPMGGGGGMQTIVHKHEHTVTLTGRELMTGFRREIKLGGGVVQNVAGSRRA